MEGRMADQPAGPATGAIVIVTTTVAEEADAARLARLLVEGRLAACVQATPISSTYLWDGAVQTTEEFRLDAKTTRARAGAAMAVLTDAHPYEEPELLLTRARASHDYVAWVRSVVGQPTTA